MNKQIITHVCCQCDQFFDIIDPVDAVRSCPFCGSEEQTPYSHSELSKGGIPWRKYEPTDRSIESHVKHLVTNGNSPMLAIHAKKLQGEGYEWSRAGGYTVRNVTHWAPINLPGEEEA